MVQNRCNSSNALAVGLLLTSLMLFTSVDASAFPLHGRLLHCVLASETERPSLSSCCPGTPNHDKSRLLHTAQHPSFATLSGPVSSESIQGMHLQALNIACTVSNNEHIVGIGKSRPNHQCSRHLLGLLPAIMLYL